MPDTVEQPRRKLTGAIVPALAAAGLAGLGAMFMVSRQGADVADAVQAGCILEGIDAVGGPISLVDPRGNTVTQADFASAPAVVYFGFTHCPDACPTTMYALTEALALQGGYDVQPILINIDPERDTPEVMGAYTRTEGFPEGLVGLTGTPAQVAAAADVFRVAYSRSRSNGEDYQVNHTSLLYVMDSNWRTMAAIPTFSSGMPDAQGVATPNPATPQQLAACINAGLDRSQRLGVNNN